MITVSIFFKLDKSGEDEPGVWPVESYEIDHKTKDAAMVEAWSRFYTERIVGPHTKQKFTFDFLSENISQVHILDFKFTIIIEDE